MKSIEKYKCQVCNYQWGVSYATFETPSCPICEEHLTVVETTDTDKSMTDKEQLKEIKNHLDRFMNPANKPCLFREDAEWLISTVEDQAEKIAKTETYLLDISGRMDDLHEYLRENHYGKGLGKHIVDVAIQVMREQQKEIEHLKLTKLSMDSIEDYTNQIKEENKRYRKLLLGILKLKHVDKMFKRQISEALEGK